MTAQPIHDEVVPYTRFLYRKGKWQRLTEVVVFLAGFFVMLPFFAWSSAPFVVALLLWGAMVMASVPAVYRIICRPRYTLYPRSLVISSRGSERTYDLSEVKPAYDLPYVYELRSKRTPLPVSDAFLEDLNARLELVKRGLDKHER